MNKYHFLLYFFLLLIPTARNTAAPLILPPVGWQIESRETFSPETLCRHIDGAAELLLEFGFKKMTAARLSRKGSQFSVEIYQMAGPLSALGIYLNRCAPETPIAGVIPRNSGDSFQLELVKSACFIVINRFDKNRKSLPLMEKLANKLAAEIPNIKVKWPCTLPEKGKIKGSVRLARGPLALRPVLSFGEDDVLRLHGKTWAVIADYRVRKGKETLIRINYQDEKKSRAVFISLLENPNSRMKISRKNDTSFVFRNNDNEKAIVQRHGNILDIRKIYSIPPSESRRRATRPNKRRNEHAD
ncbi:MAG: hypothetical protein GXO69_01345 [Acidobacteria bacterium]|nr:hypothetical protein [Acidobacteriota bacterium]